MVMEKEILSEIDRISGQMIDSVLTMVRIDSVKKPMLDDAPFGRGVKKALDQALLISESLGFQVKNLDNYIGYAQYGQGEDYVCAIGHVDVVPPGEGWKQPPFSGYLKDGVIYSRGVLDNKGPVISCLYGMFALKLLGIKPVHPIRVIFGCDEESGFHDMNHYLKQEKPPIYGFTPDCKYPVVYSERGRAVVKFHTETANLNVFFRFLNAYFLGAGNTGDRLGIDYSNPEYGTMEMRNYRLKTEGDSVAFEVTLSYPAGIGIEELLAKLQKSSGNIRAELVHNYDPVVFQKDSPMVRALQDCYETVTGLNGTPVTTTGGTYAKVMPNIVPFGPSFPGQKGIGHNPDEWMKVEDIIMNAKIYALALYRLSRL